MFSIIFNNLDIADPASQAVPSFSEDSAVLCIISVSAPSSLGKWRLHRTNNPMKTTRSNTSIHRLVNCNWKFLFTLPDIFAQDMVKAKNTITGALTDYYQQLWSELPGSVRFVYTFGGMLREVGLTEDEMGGFVLLHYWV